MKAITVEPHKPETARLITIRTRRSLCVPS
jgi:hypothetical protein